MSTKETADSREVSRWMMSRSSRAYCGSPVSPALTPSAARPARPILSRTAWTNGAMVEALESGSAGWTKRKHILPSFDRK